MVTYLDDPHFYLYDEQNIFDDHVVLCMSIMIHTNDLILDCMEEI